MQGRVPGFVKGEGGRWLPEVAESMGYVVKLVQFENWNTIENCFTRNTGNAIK